VNSNPVKCGHRIWSQTVVLSANCTVKWGHLWIRGPHFWPISQVSLYAVNNSWQHCINQKMSSKNVQVKKTHSDQYARVPKHGSMLSLFDPVIGLVELWCHLTETKEAESNNGINSSLNWRLVRLSLLYLYVLWCCTQCHYEWITSSTATADVMHSWLLSFPPLKCFHIVVQNGSIE
jgi:hypothetical protein